MRVLVGDTDSEDQLLQDAEVSFFLTLACGATSGSVNAYAAAAAACRAIAGRFARYVTKAIGPAKLNASDMQRHYLDLAERYFVLSREWSTGMYAGGISFDDKQTDVLDTDRVPPFFSRNMDRPLGLQQPTFEPMTIVPV